MASRRKLKKTIQYIASELITELYFRCLISDKISVEKTDNIVIEITEISREFILRSNRPTGKDNQELVKKYYRKLYSDWQKAIEKIIKDIENL